MFGIRPWEWDLLMVDEVAALTHYVKQRTEASGG